MSNVLNFYEIPNIQRESNTMNYINNEEMKKNGKTFKMNLNVLWLSSLNHIWMILNPEKEKNMHTKLLCIDFFQ